MNKQMIVANWKNHPDSLAEAVEIMDSVDEYLGPRFDESGLLEEEKFSLVFCPPFVFTEEIGKILKTSHLAHQAELGAQDISVDDETTLTGEVSGPMLRKLGVRYVIVGHSERRWKLGESDETVNKKLKAALGNELVPIVCLGERTRSTSSGQARDWKNFLRQQTKATFEGLTADEVARCVIAYEPVWAISTTPGARPDTPESALESTSMIKEVINLKFKIGNLKFLYGGSVTSMNARDFLGSEGIEGILVGGASVKIEEFLKILAAAAKLYILP